MSATLRRNGTGRWFIVEGDGERAIDVTELHCGDVIQVLIGGHWITTRIEHVGSSDYYATTRGVMLTDGLPARKL